MLVFALEALYNILSRPFHFWRSAFGSPRVRRAPVVVRLGRGQLVFANERRLLAVEDELDIASKMQLAFSRVALPTCRFSA